MKHAILLTFVDGSTFYLNPHNREVIATKNADVILNDHFWHGNDTKGALFSSNEEANAQLEEYNKVRDDGVIKSLEVVIVNYKASEKCTNQ